jgi:hypothetical protein
MNFIDDNDLVTTINRPVLYPFPERSHFIDPTVRCPINLKDINRMVVVNGRAKFAFIARSGGGTLLTV